MSKQRQKIMFLTSPSQTQVKEKKKVILLLWPQTPFFFFFFVILLASGLATAFLSQDEII